jgi:hypothetical protein
MENRFLTRAEAADLIAQGAVLVLAGSEAALAGLPRGRWIGGSTAYFMTAEGGVCDDAHVFGTIIGEASDARSVVLAPGSLPGIAERRYANGFTYLILPGFSEAHRRYALEAGSYPDLFNQPIMGWVAGVHLSQMGRHPPKVFDGLSGTVHENAAVALHVALPDTLAADLDIVNLFTQGTGPAIVFPETEFSVHDCTVDGAAANFARYLGERQIDTRLPLVADYAGAMLNVSVEKVDTAAGAVHFYAPVVAGEIYRIARPVADYARAYADGAGPADEAAAMMSCNCILNYLYAGLEGRQAGGFVGPVTFGEIAYFLMNQTLVRLQIQPG